MPGVGVVHTLPELDDAGYDRPLLPIHPLVAAFLGRLVLPFRPLFVLLGRIGAVLILSLLGGLCGRVCGLFRFTFDLLLLFVRLGRIVRQKGLLGWQCVIRPSLDRLRTVLDAL